MGRSEPYARARTVGDAWAEVTSDLGLDALRWIGTALGMPGGNHRGKQNGNSGRVAATSSEDTDHCGYRRSVIEPKDAEGCSMRE